MKQRSLDSRGNNPSTVQGVAYSECHSLNIFPSSSKVDVSEEMSTRRRCPNECSSVKRMKIVRELENEGQTVNCSTKETQNGSHCGRRWRGQTIRWTIRRKWELLQLGRAAIRFLRARERNAAIVRRSPRCNGPTLKWDTG